MISINNPYDFANKLSNKGGLYVMGVASRLCGLHPQTLRKYERAGLIIPDRRAKTRLYSDEDIYRIKLVKSLVEDCGFNVAGVIFALRVQESLKTIRQEIVSCITERTRTSILSTIDQIQREFEGQPSSIKFTRKHRQQPTCFGLKDNIRKEPI